MPSIYIETFGCQMNEADSQYVAGRALAAGYSVATAPDAASVVLLNTCTVRDNAERRAYGRMNHFKALKDARPHLRLVVMGCLAEQDRDRMRALAPHVDEVFGTSELRRLGDALEAWRPSFETPDDGEYDERRDGPLGFALGGTADAVAGPFSHLRAHVTVQRGCSYYCTFCIVPHVRGRFDHRPHAEILEEAARRVAEGAREVMLVGQTVNAWRDASGEADFGDLCKDVAALPGLERLTFISPHPKDFTQKIVGDLAGIAALNPRIHLPLQSAADPVLRRMNRKYTAAQFDATLESIRSRLPNCAITTDIIVGFPGETEADFDATLSYVRAGHFANAFVFVYSTRRGTPAARWEQVESAVAAERFRRLFDAQNEVTRAYHDRKIGSVVRALVVGDSKKDAGRLAAKALDNVTLVATKPGDYPATPPAEEHPYALTPWLDVAVESAHVWGCTGTILRRAARYDDPGTTVPRPLVDLIVS
jgi:tRNA-2-methylthio-N6-dimethylallyladenosine synthase